MTAALPTRDSSEAPESRYRSLDALRGAAALIVVFHHCLLTFPVWANTYFQGPSSTLPTMMSVPPLALLWAGRASVIVFFALSGFVLTLMLERKPAMSYRAYVAKRVCRLYIPYIVGVAVALVLMLSTRPHGRQLLSDWFNFMWSSGVNARLVANHVLMLGGSTYNYVDNPIWSLVHEMRYSLIFPLIVWIAKRWPPAVTLSCALIFSLAARTVLLRTDYNTLVDSSQYVFVFLGGAILALHRKSVSDWFEQRTPSVRISLTLLSLVLLCAGNFDWIANRPLRALIWIAMHAGSVLLILCVVGARRGGAILRTAPLGWLGRVSYSLYLTHLVVLLTLVYALRGVSPNVVILMVPAAALLFADLFNRLVERPAITLGRDLARVIDAKRRASHAL